MCIRDRVVAFGKRAGIIWSVSTFYNGRGTQVLVIISKFVFIFVLPIYNLRLKILLIYPCWTMFDLRSNFNRKSSNRTSVSYTHLFAVVLQTSCSVTANKFAVVLQLLCSATVTALQLSLIHIWSPLHSCQHIFCLSTNAALLLLYIHSAGKNSS